ncbi:isoamyl acetate-hydrolyzing esterase 1 homolog isoform X2 [Antennarius striatus]|uniref:isoamyl acetate-hydrolyzing esterase 1 homolog isoform X2 n=1 Tax=Antennarius striatus TaxID=241820 RepID=UPI0035AD7C83
MSKITAMLWPQVILFGDSITQFSFQAHGWGAKIAHKLARKCDVVNRGLSGYNSRWAKIVLPRLISSQRSSDIVAVTVFFGANDSAMNGSFIHRTCNDCHVPLEEYAENLKEITRHLASAGVSADRVIFITPPPVYEPIWEKECILKGCALNRHNSTAGQYTQACVQAAAQCGADILDLWTLMQKDGQDYSVYLSDGLHLSERGNQFVAEHLWRLLESRVANLPFILPYWGDIDVKNPESSLLCDQ